MATMWLALNAVLFAFLLGQQISVASVHLNHDVDASTFFPAASEVLEAVHLSFSMYTLKNKVSACDGDDIGIFRRVLPNDTSCLLYSHDLEEGTQALVVRSTSKKFIGVVYAGTDDWRTALLDGEIILSPFGYWSGVSGNNSTTNSTWRDFVPSDVEVHRGFNNAVFSTGGFESILNTVKSALDETPGYRILTMGHSLGAADSVITAVALYLNFPQEIITSINFGQPKIGNYAWAQWLKSLSPNITSNMTGGVNVYRFVNGRDVVPRLPEYPFRHAGHTIQIDQSDESCCLAFYHHEGDDYLNYSGVPFSWNVSPLVWLPSAFREHRSAYVKNLMKAKPVDEDVPYFQEFVGLDDTVNDAYPTDEYGTATS
ncbi:predicted protein [Thalassiosira pseudonana CCMP1335]|jgi:hypothetical protein|uniref:Fungal lipase-type domain-containing protein n=1 Tax=Thalassiosira pseudonana TaxID=35128 RepID=B8C744_THAPS|nr:predicted protein [Thalassiosira pseudonana CCMP1335]EED90679.1 predicted protein [Thalassiosira pseudonana CCMP1335]